jgi:hypothetical protein
LNANCTDFNRQLVDSGLVSQCSSIDTLPVTMTLLPSGFPLLWYEKGFDNYRAVCNNANCDTPTITKDSAQLLSSRGMYADNTGKPFQVGVDDCPAGSPVEQPGSSLDCMYVRVCNSDCSQVAEYVGMPLDRFSEPVAGVLNGRTVIYGAAYRKDGVKKIVMYDLTDLVACTPPNCPSEGGAASVVVSLFGMLAVAMTVALLM